MLNQSGFDVSRGKYLPGFHPDRRDEYPPEFRKLAMSDGQIRDRGLALRSLEQAMVDFPALYKRNKEVFCCRKAEEKDMEFWRGLDTGFTDRAHIDDFKVSNDY